mmetsp:Transcript_10289/g.15707  ORF Transcript_10289/g.15707 Transcript_10289/m.15707 type:complete len:102 (+) Transcript_10289:466-771(+)
MYHLSRSRSGIMKDSSPEISHAGVGYNFWCCCQASKEIADRKLTESLSLDLDAPENIDKMRRIAKKYLKEIKRRRGGGNPIEYLDLEDEFSSSDAHIDYHP